MELWDVRVCLCGVLCYWGLRIPLRKNVSGLASVSACRLQVHCVHAVNWGNQAIILVQIAG